MVSLPSSIRHSWTPSFWSVHVQQLLSIMSMLLFVDQWIVSVSNMDLMFVSMLSVCLCHSYGILFQLLEDNIMTFVKKELKKIQKVLSPDYPESSESQREDGEVLKGEDEEQKSFREALMKITVDFLRRMKQEELAERLQSSKMI